MGNVEDTKPMIDKFDLNDFTIIKEGEAEILMHAKNQVFYNKAQISFRSLAILPGGKNYARKRVVRSSQVEMDPVGRRSSQLIAWSRREK
ncbi:probable tRNA (guanine(26)-N(2))-dimethyltransferase 1 [Tanacetum coccineum]